MIDLNQQTALKGASLSASPSAPAPQAGELPRAGRVGRPGVAASRLGCAGFGDSSGNADVTDRSIDRTLSTHIIV
jgi:hypothetical protein